MNRKVLVLSVSMLLVGAVAVFAQAGPGGMNGRGGTNGSSRGGFAPGMMNDDFRGQTSGQMGGRFADPRMGFGFAAEDAEEVELTGTLQLSEGETPVLKVGTSEYSLFIPPMIASEIDVQNGTRVQVTGLSFSAPNPDLVSNETIVHVRILQIGNDRYISAGGRW